MFTAVCSLAWCFQIQFTLLDRSGVREVTERYEFDRLADCRVFENYFKPWIGKPKVGGDLYPEAVKNDRSFIIIIHSATCEGA